MASSGQQDTDGTANTAPETPGGVVTPAGEALTSRTEEMIVGDPSSDQPPSPEDAATEVHRAPIPPLLTDAPDLTKGASPVEDTGAVAPSTPTTQADVDAALDADDAEAPTSIGGPASKERIADVAAAARERVSGGADAARERVAEGAGAAKERFSEGADAAKERLSGGAAKGKERGSKARKRFADAASEARGIASNAASEARERASNADVKEFAHSTTSLIDTARPFFLAGCAALFAVLGFLEGDSGTAELFVFGSLLFVIGAAFSGEINAYLASRSSRQDDDKT